jgi:hypothetical protein
MNFTTKHVWGSVDTEVWKQLNDVHYGNPWIKIVNSFESRLSDKIKKQFSFSPIIVDTKILVKFKVETVMDNVLNFKMGDYDFGKINN